SDLSNKHSFCPLMEELNSNLTDLFQKTTDTTIFYRTILKADSRQPFTRGQMLNKWYDSELNI
ncbi:MAG TPA: hypothetical protein PKI10_01860, partial [Syntrophorhabdus sp.]|nr:hypothetical protein [Syntrophorhabdus sp.]